MAIIVSGVHSSPRRKALTVGRESPDSLAISPSDWAFALTAMMSNSVRLVSFNWFFEGCSFIGCQTSLYGFRLSYLFTFYNV